MGGLFPWAGSASSRVSSIQELFEGHPIGNFQLSAAAEAAIVAFLKTLTDRQ
jgi:hypothetical protein